MKKKIIISNIKKEFLESAIVLEKNQLSTRLKKKLGVNLTFEESQIIITPERNSFLSTFYPSIFASKKNSQILENAINRIKNILTVEHIDAVVITRYA